ncbi:tripartite tricarboxylate transporter substrate binding protein [soil metagenome]
MTFPSPHGLTRRCVLQAATAAAAIAATPVLRAQGFPNRPVRLVVPQSAGGAADRLARTIAQRLEAMWKQPVTVENKPGGGVVIGTLATARAVPDGYTLGLLGSSLSINAVQRKDLPYDTLKDLQPIARIGYYTMALLATASFPANDMRELIALAKKQPGAISFASNGIGTSAQLAGELLNHMAGIELQHVPYNGAAKMYTDMVGKQVPIGFSVASSAETFIKSGQLKVLGVTSKERSALHRDWPALAETLPGFEVVNWAGFAAPAGLPPDIANRLSADILASLSAPEVAKTMTEMGIDVLPQGPAEFKAFIQSEIERFAAVTTPLGAPST